MRPPLGRESFANEPINTHNKDYGSKAFSQQSLTDGATSTGNISWLSNATDRSQNSGADPINNDNLNWQPDTAVTRQVMRKIPFSNGKIDWQSDATTQSQDIKVPPNSGSNSGSNYDADFLGAIQKLIQNAEKRAVRKPERAESPGEELQGWFRQAMERERRHDEGMKGVGSNHDSYPAGRILAIPDLHQTPHRRILRPIEPWRFRAPRPDPSRRSFHTARVSSDLSELAQGDARLDANRNLDCLVAGTEEAGPSSRGISTRVSEIKFSTPMILMKSG